jgi:transposase
MILPEKKTRIVLAIFGGEMAIAEAARKEKVSEQSIRGGAEFIEAGRTALVAGRSRPPSREEQMEAEVVELTQALGEAHVELRVWKKRAEGRLCSQGPRGNPY